jgi:hypothetical protein
LKLSRLRASQVSWIAIAPRQCPGPETCCEARGVGVLVRAGRLDNVAKLTERAVSDTVRPRLVPRGLPRPEADLDLALFLDTPPGGAAAVEREEAAFVESTAGPRVQRI